MSDLSTEEADRITGTIAKHNFNQETPKEVLPGPPGSWTGQGPYPQLTLFYSGRELEHKDRMYLMQRYFAWSIYALMFLWLVGVLACTLLNSIGSPPAWLINSTILGGMGGFAGICFGLLKAVNGDGLKNRSSAELREQEILNIENYFQVLLKELVSGGISFGLIGFVLGIVLACNCDKMIITSFQTDKTVLITLISSTTLGVLGIFAAVMKWLFPCEHKSER